MIIRLIIASVVVAAPLAFAAGYWQSQHQADLPPTVGVRLNAPILTKPGAGAADAAKYLAVLNTPPPPPPPPPAVQPPDVGLTFRREVTAVTTDKAPYVILADGRHLGRGQDYRDGWKVRLITTDSVTLAKGAETRSINLFSAPAATPQAQPGLAGVGGFGQISLTNGERPGQLNAGVINRILDALRALGLSQAQLDQLRRTLSAGSMNQQQAIQMISTALRGRTATQVQISNLVQAFVAAGVLQQNVANGLTQQFFAQQQNQQVQGIFNGRGGGGPNGGLVAPPGGFGGGRGGFGGRRGGPFGLTPPNVAPPATAPAGIPAPGRAATAPIAGPLSQRNEADQPLRLAQLAEHPPQDRATIQ